jgi:hypothetical protein
MLLQSVIYGWLLFTPFFARLVVRQRTTRKISFSVVTNDFGVKYVDGNNAHYLAKALQELCTISANWIGTLYCGLTIK